MKHNELYMDFNEALEAHPAARDGLRLVGEGRNAQTLREDMCAAAAHMDALAPRHGGAEHTSEGG